IGRARALRTAAAAHERKHDEDQHQLQAEAAHQQNIVTPELASNFHVTLPLRFFPAGARGAGDSVYENALSATRAPPALVAKRGFRSLSNCERNSRTLAWNFVPSFRSQERIFGTCSTAM